VAPKHNGDLDDLARLQHLAAAALACRMEERDRDAALPTADF
jgi:hypothetical protein